MTRLGGLAVLFLLAAGTGGLAQTVESEAAVNRRGYALLRQGDTQGAIRVFQQNVEAHPLSANVYDSLAEAYEAAGETALAIESYRARAGTASRATCSSGPCWPWRRARCGWPPRRPTARSSTS